MHSARILSLAATILLVAVVAHGDTITSTAAGGDWSSAATWVGGVVPAADDDVIVAGPVGVDGIQNCLSLTVLESGAVTGALVAPPLQLNVAGAVDNAGVIDDGDYPFQLRVGGDLHNAGTWANDLTTLTGAGDRELSVPSPAGLGSEIATGPGAAGDILVTTPVTFGDFVDVGGMRLVLQPGCHLTLAACIFSGEILAGGNELRFESWSYLTQATVDDAVLVGIARAAQQVVFTSRLEVKDQLENPTSTGGGAATVDGDLVNHGLIRNVNYSFFFSVHGDIENHGTIATPNLELPGPGVEHRLRMGPGAILDATVFLPEFQAATLIAETPVTFGDGLGLGVGTLVLEPGASLHFDTHSGLGSGHVEANGNTITTATGNSGLSQCTIDQAVFGDYAAVHGDLELRGGATVLGTLTGWPWAEANVSVAGRLRVEGTVTDGDHPVNITVLHDLENLGVMDNARVVLAGTVDQAVGAGPGIAVPDFVLESGLQAASYQWYRDGAALPGETGPSLVFDTVGAADYGVYHCEGDGELSRSIAIAELLDLTDVPGIAAAALEQNHPNPFNPATNIAFSLQRGGAVSLAVYDLAGREVDRLIGGELAAGRHSVTWQPRGLASGIYVYRLQADGVDLARKCSLLK